MRSRWRSRVRLPKVPPGTTDHSPRFESWVANAKTTKPRLASAKRSEDGRGESLESPVSERNKDSTSKHGWICRKETRRAQKENARTRSDVLLASPASEQKRQTRSRSHPVPLRLLRLFAAPQPPDPASTEPARYGVTRATRSSGNRFGLSASVVQTCRVAASISTRPSGPLMQ